MTNLRAGLLAHLKSKLPDYKVIGYPYAPDGITSKTLAFWTTDLAPLASAPNGHYSVDYNLEIYTGHQDPARVDDVLDESLTDVLDALWDLDSYVLVNATRTTTQDNSIHSWTLTLRGGISISKEQ